VVPWAERVGFASRTDDGRFIGPFNPSLLSPVTAGSFLDFQAAEEKNTSLSPRVRQVVILAVGAVWRSAYELYAHPAEGRETGLSAEAVQALAVGQRAFGTNGLADMLLLIGAYQTVCGLLNTFEIPAP
jgi:4-carboxymuconolactone decarboxylase